MQKDVLSSLTWKRHRQDPIITHASGSPGLDSIPGEFHSGGASPKRTSQSGIEYHPDPFRVPLHTRSRAWPAEPSFCKESSSISYRESPHPSCSRGFGTRHPKEATWAQRLFGAEGKQQTAGTHTHESSLPSCLPKTGGPHSLFGSCRPPHLPVCLTGKGRVDLTRGDNSRHPPAQRWTAICRTNFAETSHLFPKQSPSSATLRTQAHDLWETYPLPVITSPHIPLHETRGTLLSVL